MGGTWALNLFDRLHLGHHVMLERLADMPAPVACVTGGELVAHDLELAQIVQPLALRVQRLKEYLRDVGLDDTIQVTSLTSFRELLRIEGATQFLMYAGPCCDEIREHGLRARLQVWPDDKLEYLKPVRAQDGEKLTSARVRKGEVDRMGRLLRGTEEPPRRLPLHDRARLQTPKGEVLDKRDGPPEDRAVRMIERETPPLVIAVGDVTSATLIRAGFQPDVCIVDGATKRGAYGGVVHAERQYLVYNPAGVLYPEAWSVVGTAVDDGCKSVVFVDGEEDLLGFPAVLLAPEGAVMLYGQPDVGIVWVPVTEENRTRARRFLEEMPVIGPGPAA